MTREDFAWAAGVFEVAVAPRQGHHKNAWEWRTGSFEGFQRTVASLWPWLGMRRKSKARSMLVKT